jgi:hypothetical protein
MVVTVIKDSARKRGHSEEDIRHALTNAIRVWPMDGYDIVIGPLADGSLIEVGVNPDGDIFHAMKARTKFL